MVSVTRSARGSCSCTFASFTTHGCFSSSTAESYPQVPRKSSQSLPAIFIAWRLPPASLDLILSSPQFSSTAPQFLNPSLRFTSLSFSPEPPTSSQSVLAPSRSFQCSSMIVRTETVSVCTLGSIVGVTLSLILSVGT